MTTGTTGAASDSGDCDEGDTFIAMELLRLGRAKVVEKVGTPNCREKKLAQESIPRHRY